MTILGSYRKTELKPKCTTGSTRSMLFGINHLIARVLIGYSSQIEVHKEAATMAALARLKQERKSIRKDRPHVRLEYICMLCACAVDLTLNNRNAICLTSLHHRLIPLDTSHLNTLHIQGFSAKPSKDADGAMDMYKWKCVIPGRDGKSLIPKLEVYLRYKYI